MALERQSIEKKDFPIGRRGYEPEAVDAHLAEIAREVEQLKVSSRRRTETLASAASEQVRAIVEAAEKSAAEIQRQAETEAQEIRAEAAEEAQSTRQHASTQAREYVGRVSESTAGMLSRLDAMESELGALIESLRTGANRLNADLQLLESGMQEVRGSVEPRPRFEREADGGLGPAGPAPDFGSSAFAQPAPPQPSSEAEPAIDEPDAGFGEPDRASETGSGYEPADARGEDETEGARLIALNMALNGTPREETQRYLADNFKLGDPDGLLDEVYASVEG
ncbi:MAG TPA: DivIVA domain-containing protein [Solirubrobacteraceae bacterium]|nr:DivIVA domain-containing protein [Solirubrobacteraceae bacterium]